MFLALLTSLAASCSDNVPAPKSIDIPISEMTTVHQWDIFEIPLHATTPGNPFDVKLQAKFTSGYTSYVAHGFYDGNGTFRIRFMPPTQGTWYYETTSDLPELSGKTGDFACIDPRPTVHGPVGVRNTFHFAYADGTPFIPLSTTLYGWVNQRSSDLQDETLTTLKSSPFNRIRMMILPISFSEDNVPLYYPFEMKADKSWDYSKFDPRFFQHIDMRLAQLRDMGIEAELVIFHNRGNKKGVDFDKMPADADDRYLRYVIARYAAYRNVWWNMANEFDSLKAKTDADWDRLFSILLEEDPYQHLRSIHQMHRYYDATLPVETYMSIQNGGAVSTFGTPDSFRQGSQKPVIFDEIEYEGDKKQSWAHLPPQDMVYRFWLAFVSGTYATHGETLDNAPGTVWISRGGKLMGESPKRIAFMKQVLATAPVADMLPINPQDTSIGISGKVGEYYLIYFGKSAPEQWAFNLPAGRFVRPGTKYHVDVIDTWNMTITPVDQLATAPEKNSKAAPMGIPLPGRPFIALRIQRVH
jgi:hypothetical protein